MKCRICARECPPGAKICRDCAAARKRAFAATVTQPLLAAVGAPSVGRPRFAPRPERPRPAYRTVPSARSEAAVAASAADQSAPASHLSVKWLLLGLAVATTVVFVVIKILASGSGQVAEAVDAESETPASVTTSDAGSGSASPRDGVQKQGDAVAQRAILSPDAGVAPKPVAPKATRKAAGKVQTAKAVSAEPTPGPKAEPVAAAPRPAPPRAVEAPRDPWQVMNEGLSRCAREDFFSRIACEQRLRLQYCPNHWGTVPQCPIGPATDHGQ